MDDNTRLNGVTDGDIRKGGMISLSNGTSGRILMPSVLLRAICFHLRLVDDDCLNPLKLSTPQSLERLLPISMLLQTNLLFELGETETAYKDIVPGT